MTTLDYAHIYETQIRPRQRRRRAWLTAAVVVLALGPLVGARLIGLA